MHNPLPEQLPQYQQQQLQLPTPAANNQLALPQHQMQKEIRLMVESEMARAMYSQKNPTQQPSFESVSGHQDSSDFKLA